MFCRHPKYIAHQCSKTILKNFDIQFFHDTANVFVCISLHFHKVLMEKAQIQAPVTNKTFSHTTNIIYMYTETCFFLFFHYSELLHFVWYRKTLFMGICQISFDSVQHYPCNLHKIYIGEFPLTIQK